MESLEQFVDSEVNEYFVGKITEVDINGLDLTSSYRTHYDVTSGILSLDKRVDSPFSRYLKFDFPYSEIKILIERKQVGLIRKIFNFFIYGKLDDLWPSYLEASRVEDLVCNHFNKSSDIKKSELGSVRILGYRFMVSLINLSESDHNLANIKVGNVKPWIDVYDNGMGDDWSPSSSTVYGKATGTLYKFNLRLKLKD